MKHTKRKTAEFWENQPSVGENQTFYSLGFVPILHEFRDYLKEKYLTRDDIIVYWLIASHAGSGVAFPGISYMSELLSMKRNKVIDHIKNLESLALLHVKRETGKKSLYTVLYPKKITRTETSTQTDTGTSIQTDTGVVSNRTPVPVSKRIPYKEQYINNNNKEYTKHNLKSGNKKNKKSGKFDLLYMS